MTSIINGVLCRLLIDFNKWVGIDDYSVSGVVHGFGGIIADTLTGIFATKTVAGYDGITEISGGWVDGNFRQIGLQIAAWCSIVAWTFVFTMIILFAVDKIPGLHLRATSEAEEMGMDLFEMAETLDEFGNDYDMFFRENASKLRAILDHYEDNVEVLEGRSISEGSVSRVHHVNGEKV